MLRELQTIMNKNADTMFRAKEDMVTGMAVVKDHTDKTADLANMDDDGTMVFFVEKERVPQGIDTGRGDLSDYHEGFTNIVAGEFVKLLAPLPGERYGTDQYVDGLTVGDRVMPVNGVFGAADKPTPFVFTGFYDDAGHKLAAIEVEATAR